MKHYDLVIIGGGASGINCAIFAKLSGIDNVLVVEKEDSLGGALIKGDYNLSERSNFIGEVYRERKLGEYDNLNIDTYLNTTVLKIEDENIVLMTSKDRGIEKIKARAIVIANGGKEIGLNKLEVTGDRCSGILTIGMTEKILNMGLIPGKEVIIYGTDNLYKIFNKLKKNNINIKGIVCEKLSDQILGLSKNLYLGYKLDEVIGKGRLEKIKISKNLNSEYVDCDTLILAKPMVCDGIIALRSGLKINADTMGIDVSDCFMTSKEGIFACGNSIRIHNSMEELLEEARKTIENVRKYLGINKKSIFE